MYHQSALEIKKNPVCSEKSNFNPYGKKALTDWLSKYYRENYRLNVSNEFF